MRADAAAPAVHGVTRVPARVPEGQQAGARGAVLPPEGSVQRDVWRRGPAIDPHAQRPHPGAVEDGDRGPSQARDIHLGGGGTGVGKERER